VFSSLEDFFVQKNKKTLN